MISNIPKWISKHIPIWGSLAIINGRAQLEAFYELLLTVVFSTLPIWFFSLLSAVNQYSASSLDERSISLFFDLYMVSMRKTISNAELFIYVTSTLGPTLYLGLSSFGRSGKPFPWVRIQLVSAILISFIATGLFITVRNTESTSDSFLIGLSILLYIFALLLLFPAMALGHEGRLINPAEYQSTELDNFQHDYSKHRGQQ